MTSVPVEHTPVLLHEVIELLVADRKGTYYDGTLGDGGYTRSLLAHLNSEGRVIASDWDAEAIHYAGEWAPAFGRRLSVHHGDFCDIHGILSALNIKAVNGMVLDLGLSSRQLNVPERGFSYRTDGPLDMRMDNRRRESAMDVVNKISEGGLKKIFFEYGEERRSASLARIIIRERRRSPITTTFDLAVLMKKHWRPRYYTKSASRIFQSLRIAVNRELDNLELFLDICWQWLHPRGRIAVVTYHSLEDRLVKTAFRRHENPCICPKEAPMCQCGRIPDAIIITRKPARPSAGEIARNPRARSAKLRVAEKL